MPREFSRADRVADQIQRELASMVQREVKDPRLGMVTISDVRVTRDFGYADVYITLLSAEELNADSEQVRESLAVLERASGFLRKQLGRVMRLRTVPQLRFHFDRLAGESRRIESLIRRAVDEDRSRQSDDDDGSEP